MDKRTHRKDELHALQGWREIANYLAQPIAVVQRWANSGMPVTREGRRLYASPNDLNLWLARESAGEPIHIAAEDTDMLLQLQRGLSFVRKQHARKPKKRAA
jgi:phage terminase Nu1 subunit (DNA packaging protein)